MARQPIAIKDVVAEIPADLPAQNLHQLPPELAQRMDNSANASTAPVLAPAPGGFNERPIGRSPEAIVPASVLTFGMHLNPTSVPGFLGGLKPEQQAARDALQQLSGTVLALVAQTNVALLQAEAALKSCEALPTAAEASAREGIDLAKTAEVLKDFRAVFTTHGL